MLSTINRFHSRDQKEEQATYLGATTTTPVILRFHCRRLTTADRGGPMQPRLQIRAFGRRCLPACRRSRPKTTTLRGAQQKQPTTLFFKQGAGAKNSKIAPDQTETPRAISTTPRQRGGGEDIRTYYGNEQIQLSPQLTGHNTCTARRGQEGVEAGRG